MADSSKPQPWTYLRAVRRRAGYSPKSAALALGISLTHYCSVEAGRRGFGEEVLIRAARLFDQDAEELDGTRPEPVRVASMAAS